jgi:NADH dehydrogenase [ubiquinone] 1 alpha subcomplex assembly factor 7
LIPAIKAAIAESGPLPLARAMALASDHYYATHQPFGATGDFVTAPDISQMFGELIGLFLADLWTRAGSPEPVLIVELGPGRGTLMADARRAIASAVPALASAPLHLVEKSPRLRAEQALRTSENLLHTVIHEIPDVLVLKDQQGNFGFGEADFFVEVLLGMIVVHE